MIGKGAKTGSNNTFVAPVRIGDGAMTGGGTVVRKDVPDGALAVSAATQRNLEGHAERRAAKLAREQAAAAAETAPDDPGLGATDPGARES